MSRQPGIRAFAIVTAAAALAAVVAVPALGTRADAAAAHEYGEMVDYPLTFPAAGDVWYDDWFYAPRANGIHHAQDLMGAKMVPVVAAASGVIERVNWSRDPGDLRPGDCCSLTLRHDDGWESWYIHLNNDTPGTDDGQGWGIAPGIVPGTRVAAGQLIGWIGDSGNAEATDPHLHFELYDPNGQVVNPYEALRAAQHGTSVCTPAGTAGFEDLLGTNRLLRTGTRGGDVADLQRFLTAVGFDPGPIDGIFGPLTDAAVRAFQGDRSLVVDGIVGAQTLFAIAPLTGGTGRALLGLLDPEARVIRLRDTGNDVEMLQQWLRIAGYDPGPADGSFGSLTAAAVREFQATQGLTVDAIVGPATRAALADLLGVTAIRSCP